MFHLFKRNKRKTYKIHPELQKIYDYQFDCYLKGKDTSVFFIQY